MRAQFDAGKALELILYAASRLQRPGLHNVSKVLYFSDKDHLARYGRFMAGAWHGVRSRIVAINECYDSRPDPWLPLTLGSHFSNEFTSPFCL